MKLSNYVPSPRRLSSEQKLLIEKYFFGGKGKAFTDDRGIVLNKTWQISVLTGISEYRITRYLNKILTQKRNQLNEEKND